MRIIVARVIREGADGQERQRNPQCNTRWDNSGEYIPGVCAAHFSECIDLAAKHARAHGSSWTTKEWWHVYYFLRCLKCKWGSPQGAGCPNINCRTRTAMTVVCDERLVQANWFAVVQTQT